MIETLNTSEFIRIGMETTLAISALILLVLVLRRPFAKMFGANIVYALWALPVLRLVMPPLPGWMSLNLWSGPATDTSQINALHPVEVAVTSETPTFILVQGSGLPELTVVPAALGIDTAASHSPILGLLTYLPLALLGIWAIGALVFLGLHVTRQMSFARLLRAEAHPASLALQTLGAELQLEIGLRHQIPLKSSLISNGPLVAGLFRPFVLLPEWFEEDFTDAEQRDAIRHEMTHLKRRDLWALHLAILGLAAQWFNPLAYVALRAFRSDQEAACDADVLRGSDVTPQSYGSTIIKAVRLSSASNHTDYAAALTMTHAIKERLILMQKPVPSRQRRLSGSVIAMTLALGGLAITASTGTAQTVLFGDNDSNVFTSDMKDRQLVLLSDPFEFLEPRMKAMNLVDMPIFQAMPVFDMEFMDDFSNMDYGLSGLSALTFLGDLSGFDGPEIITEKTENGTRIIIPRQEFILPDNMEGLEARMELLGEKMELFGEVMEARSELFEERMEVWSEKFEEQMETRMEGFEEDIEDAADVVEDLSDQCEDHEFTNSEPVIFTASSDATGKTYRAACVKGDRANLKSAAVMSFVANNADLSDEEKARFRQDRDVRFHFRHD